MAPETSFFQNPGYKRSFTDVPLDGDKIATKEFIEACESLTVIFEYLSGAFSVVSKDLNGNITVCPPDAHITHGVPLHLPLGQVQLLTCFLDVL